MINEELFGRETHDYNHPNQASSASPSCFHGNERPGYDCPHLLLRPSRPGGRVAGGGSRVPPCIQDCLARKQLFHGFEPVHLTRLRKDWAPTLAVRGVLSFLLHIYNSANRFDRHKKTRWPVSI